MDRDTLLQLRSRVREATGAVDFAPGSVASDQTDAWTRALFGQSWTFADWGLLMDALRGGSLNAALSLVERVLPGWVWSVGMRDHVVIGHDPDQAFHAWVASSEIRGGPAPWDEERDTFDAAARTAPLAVLAALLGALIDSTEKAERSPAHE